MKKKKLIIPLPDGPPHSWEVEADIVGDLGIHPSRTVKGSFRVIHVPTMLHLTSVVPDTLDKDKKKLLKWATKVQASLKKEWAAMRKFTAKDIKENPDRTVAIRNKIRDHCSNTKV